jgi:hypothetical protein
MYKVIKIDLFDDLKDDNDKFAQLLDKGQWDVLRSKLEDPDNKKSMAELVGELMEGR